MKIRDERVRNIFIALSIFMLLYMLLFVASVFAQSNIKRQGNTFIEQVDTTQTKTLKGKVYETDYIYVDRQGHAYTIFLSSNGNAFVIMTSKKSGRKRRKYLPEITKRLRDEAK